jgi:putative alpha-1,2-mannosidase
LATARASTTTTSIWTPGYYSVLLKDYNIRAELTATERALACTATPSQPATRPGSDPRPAALLRRHGKNVLSAELALQTAPDTLAGGHITKHGAMDRHAYFTMQVSKTPEKIVFYQDDKEVAPELRPLP